MHIEFENSMYQSSFINISNFLSVDVANESYLICFSNEKNLNIHIELYEIFWHENSRVVQNIVTSHILPTINEIGLVFCRKNLKRP